MTGYEVIKYIMDMEGRVTKLEQEVSYYKAEFARLHYNQSGRIKFNPVRAGAGRQDIPVQYEAPHPDEEEHRARVENPDLSEDLAALRKNLMPRTE